MAGLTPEEQYLRKLSGLPPRPPARRDGDDPAERLVSTAQAARAAHVSEATVRDWARRGLIVAVNRGDEHPLYCELDVLRVEAGTRRAARARRLADEAARGVAE